MKDQTADQEVIPKSVNEVVPFSDFQKELAELTELNKIVFDYADPKGAKEARSHIYKMKLVKGRLEKARKQLKQESLDYGRRIDADAKSIEAQLDGLVLVHETPLLEIEAREQSRKDAIMKRMETLEQYKNAPAGMDADGWLMHLAVVEAFKVDASLDEFMAPASIARDAALTFIRGQLALAQVREQEAAELARLRQEKEDRERHEREATIAREAAEKATKDAQEKADRDRVQAEEEARRKDREQAEAIQRQQEATAKAEREAAEANARAAKAEQDAKERAEKAEREAKVKAERDLAAQQESDRIAAEKREANKRHAAKINNAAVNALILAGLSQDHAKAAVTAIAQGKVPNVSIAY